MIPKPRSFRVPRNPIGLLILLAVFAAAAGCSTSTNSGGLVDASGNHPAGFVSTHPAFARPDGSACKECHGSNLQGGIVNVSCFSASRNGVACHASGPAFHPANWVDTKARGTSAWHGDAFLGNVLINGVACSSCHTLGTSGTPGTGKCVTCHFTYTAAPVRRIPVGNPTVHDWSSSQTAGHSDPAFANDNVVNAVCVACHETNLRFANPPQECHNCHAPFPSGHPAGWVATPPAAQPHGDTAKMDGTVAGQGFPRCQTCHGNDFAGTTVAPTCLNNATCHDAASPHAPKPWRASAGSTYTHTTTVETGNAPVCAQCHFFGSANNPANHPPTPPPDNTAPGCFNGTLCHGEAGAPHPVGSTWVAAPPAAQPHGDDAKAAPGATTGFSFCQECHGTGTTPPANFGGGSSGVTCTNNPDAACHGSTVASPHAPKPWRTSAGSTYTHTSTNGGNAPVCAQCHFFGSDNNPANHPPTPPPDNTAPACFNGTLCH
jgi:hypothetical protein